MQRDGDALQELRRIKLDLFECYIAEADFALFLMKCLERYGSGLPTDETFKAKWFSDRIYGLLQEIKSFERDDKLTEPLDGTIKIV